jgi:hypothetical protein
MVSHDPLDELALVSERARRFQEDAAAERFRRSTGTRRALAGSLRRLAARLDPAPFAPRPA